MKVLPAVSSADCFAGSVPTNFRFRKLASSGDRLSSLHSGRVEFRNHGEATGGLTVLTVHPSEIAAESVDPATAPRASPRGFAMSSGADGIRPLLNLEEA
jgi:hypothetical protein